MWGRACFRTEIRWRQPLGHRHRRIRADKGRQTDKEMKKGHGGRVFYWEQLFRSSRNGKKYELCVFELVSPFTPISRTNSVHISLSVSFFLYVSWLFHSERTQQITEYVPYISFMSHAPKHKAVPSQTVPVNEVMFRFLRWNLSHEDLILFSSRVFCQSDWRMCSSGSHPASFSSLAHSFRCNGRQNKR